MFDLIIRNGLIIDGTGETEAYNADIAIKDKHIIAIGNLIDVKAKEEIIASNYIITPGFIDIHTHSDTVLLVNPKAESKIRMGVTTEVVGNCGVSGAPLAGELLEEMLKSELYGLDINWNSVDEYLNRLEKQGIALNVIILIGHGTLRGGIIGMRDIIPTDELLKDMQRQLETALEQGAYGFSTGLVYSPGSFAKTDEIIALAKVINKYDAIYTTHLRSEGDTLLEAIDEALEIAKQSGVRLQISHLKAAGKKNWHKLDEALKKIENAHHNGIDIAADRYPYEITNTGLSVYLPNWVKSGGKEHIIKSLSNNISWNKIKSEFQERILKNNTWDSIMLSSLMKEDNKSLSGLTIEEAAKKRNLSPIDLARQLLIDEKATVGICCSLMCEENTYKVLTHPLVMLASDASCKDDYTILSKGNPHPRAYGTFPRFIRKYVKDKKLLSLKEAIYKMTYFPAKRLKLIKRGLLKEKYFADIVLFNLDTISDKATFKNPHQYPIGIDYVIVNGKIVIREGEHTGNLAGKVLRNRR